MKTNLKNENGSELAVYTFHLRFEGAADIAFETSGYWFDANGRLLDGNDTVDGKLSLVLTATDLRYGRLLVVPISSTGFTLAGSRPKICSRTMRSSRERFDPLLRYQTLPDIPEPVWRFWFMSRGFGLPDPRSVRAAIQSW